MPYFPTYDEMQEALESARLKMWHEHGKQVDFGGPEFTLYAMEGLGKMEAPKILDEPQGDQEAAPSEGEADVPTKVTVTKSFGVEGDVRGVAEVDGDEAEQDVQDPAPHAFKSDRSGKRCIDCREPREHALHSTDG